MLSIIWGYFLSMLSSGHFNGSVATHITDHPFSLIGHHSERTPNCLQKGTNKNSQIPFLSRCSRSCQECVKHVLTLKCEICSYTSYSQTPLWLSHSLTDPLWKSLQNTFTPKLEELGSWSFEIMFTPHHVSHVTCHVLCVTCHVSCVTYHMSTLDGFFRTQCWS